MRTLILEAPGQLRLAEVERPSPGEGELLLKVRSATTCGTDLKAFVRGHPQIPMPGPLGHEYSGDVVEAGPGAKFKVGDAVMGVHSAPCGHCYWCLHGQQNLCDSIMSSKVLGSFAEYLLVPKRIADVNVFSKPDGLSYDKAALLEPAACVARGIEEFQSRGWLPCETALVIGPGAIGLLFVAALFHEGVQRVVLAGRNPMRLAAGAALGAETVKWPEVELPEGRGFDVVIECTGQVEVWEKSVDFARRGGAVMLFGGCAGGTKVTFDTARLHYDQITLISPFHFGVDAVARARDWLLDPTFDVSSLITGVRSLEEAEQTFADLRAGLGIKYVFQP